MRLQFKPANEHALKITNGAQIIFFSFIVQFWSSITLMVHFLLTWAVNSLHSTIKGKLQMCAELGRCPWPWQKSGNKVPFKVSFNPNHSMNPRTKEPMMLCRDHDPYMLPEAVLHFEWEREFCSMFIGEAEVN